MQPIIAPIKPNDSGAQAANLIECLLFLVERGGVKTFDSPNQPTKDELSELAAKAKQGLAAQVFGEAPQRLVFYFQIQQSLGDHLRGAVEEKTAARLNELLKEYDAVMDEKPDLRMVVVTGKVTSPDRAGVGGLQVRLAEKNIGQDVALVDTVTDAQGNYQMQFSWPATGMRLKKVPDLQSSVYAGKIFLAASEVRYNATDKEILNVDLPANSMALPSEHETLTDSLALHFKGRLGDLKETDKQQDITYLANKTGWDARAVALAALADQFSQFRADHVDATGISAPFYYALFRAGLPANPDTLFQSDVEMVAQAWKTAIGQGVVPKALENEIPKAIQIFQELGAQKLLAAPALTGVSSMKEMLANASNLDESQQKIFATLYTTHRTDMPAFWKAVGEQFDEQTTQKLQVDGKLGLLTINNAPLMQKLHQTAGGDQGLSDPLSLAQKGYHRAALWKELLTDAIPIPKEIPGDTASEKQANYADYLAAQVRLSYPTAAIAEIIKREELVGKKGSDEVSKFLTAHQGKFEIGVHPFEQYIKKNDLDVSADTVNQMKRVQRVYQITPSDQAMVGMLKRGVDAAYHVVGYQKETFVQAFGADLGGADQAALTYDQSMQVHNAVLNIAISYLTASNAPGIGVHSPAQIVSPVPASSRDVIASATLEDLVGEMDYCECDHCRSVLSPAAYLVDLLLFLQSDVPQWTSFKENWRTKHGAPYPFPDNAAFVAAGRPSNTEISPFDVLMSRRPDIQHLLLTCENTNTVLPYIDVVNEALEYFVANSTKDTNNKASLEGYKGHDIGGVASEDLLASPQYVIGSAYTALSKARFPVLLPFHQPLENLRRYFDKFEVKLPFAMELLRKSDAPERGTNPYGWRDILMEEIGLSRTENEILTTSNAAPNVLWQVYGYPSETIDSDIINGNPAAKITALSNAKYFTRRIGITYEDIVEILKTRFVNPSSDLIPKLEGLGGKVTFKALKALRDAPNNTGDAAFMGLLPTNAGAPNPAEYDGDIKAWVKNDINYNRIMSLITLTDISENEDPCSFDNLEFRYAKPMANASDTSTRLGVVEFMRLLRFIRLWKKMGWTIEQTDTAICALYPLSTTTQTFANTIDTVAKLDAGFVTLLARLGIVKRVMNALNLTPKRDLTSLLTCWSDIGTHGDSALYRQMFLNPTALKQANVFADNGYGKFLVHNPQKKLSDHAEALRAAFNLTRDEFSLIVSDLPVDSNRIDRDQQNNLVLTLRNISAIYRRGWLARSLKLSVRELMLLISLTGLDPFAAPDLTDPAILRLISLVQTMKDRPLKSAAALYLIWNQDLSGMSAPQPAQITELARTLRSGLAQIESEFAIGDVRDGQIARAKMALVYGNDATDFFFGLLDNTLVTTVPYSHSQVTFGTSVSYSHGQAALDQAITDAAPGVITYDDSLKRLAVTGTLTTATRDKLKIAAGVAISDDIARGSFQAAVDRLYTENQKVIKANLEQPIVDAASERIAYDDFRKRLAYTGVLTTTILNALKAATGVTVQFQAGIDSLYAENQKIIGPFFARYPELQPLYNAYVASTDPVVTKRRALLGQILPELVKRRKEQQVLQVVSATAQSHLEFARAMLDVSPAGNALHAAGYANQPALNDFLALETQGLSVKFHANVTATGAVMPLDDIAANLNYAPAVGGIGNSLPANLTPGDPISGVWSGHLEVPESGFFNLLIETDSGATVTLSLAGQERNLTHNATLHYNTDPLELRAGTLYPIELKVENVRNIVRVQWEWNPKGQGRAYIPARYLYPAARFDAFHNAYFRFLKATSLAVSLSLTANEMAHFATDSAYQIGGEGWLNALPVRGDPTGPTAAALLTPLRALLDYARIKADLAPNDERLLAMLNNPTAATANANSLLYTLTGWDAASLNALLTHLGGNIAGLSSLPLFLRVFDAFALIQKMGIAGSALIQATTNEPTGDTVRNLQAALRARYDAAAWRHVVKPINDAMRGLQRDALVAYILHQMRSNDASKHIDTVDKLFEYFLMDIAMEPCMQTSRIRHALSTVQLFIERCLMNLEPRVSPASINAKQWEWMKRYRVWEANRKVFLYPENWLEPELRDDKSPFFKEIESELLQSDITEDSAATALINYLSKLEEVAKLEPCGIHHVEAGLTTPEIDHVVARTAGASRKYYYRRREGGSWTPWEQIKLDIEDNPVIPVVWNGRLLLFWLKILKQSPDAAMKKPDATVVLNAGMQVSSVVSDDAMSVSIRAMLCWSEYYNGKWQATKTSDVNQPADLGSYPLAGAGAFDNAQLELLSWEVVGRGLLIHVVTRNPTENMLSKRLGSFLLYNTHSLPVVLVSQVLMKMRAAFLPPPERYRYILSDVPEARGLALDYKASRSQDTKSVPILKENISARTIGPDHHLNNPWGAPFFYEDSRHVFYVTTTEQQVRIGVGLRYGANTGVIEQLGKTMSISPLILQTDLTKKIRPKFGGDGAPVVRDPGNVDPAPMQQYVTEDAYIHRGIGSTGTVTYGEKQIGPAGAIFSP